jgi:hypothetical protein
MASNNRKMPSKKGIEWKLQSALDSRMRNEPNNKNPK